MDYIKTIFAKYRGSIPTTREEEFQMATIEAIEIIFNMLDKIEKKIEKIEKKIKYL